MLSLEKMTLETSGEIYLLLKKSKPIKRKFPNLYIEQEKTFKQTAKDYLLSDILRIFIDLPKAIIKRLLHQNSQF